MPAPTTRSRPRAVAWCVLIPLGAVAAYLGLGLLLVSVLGEPILGTAMLGVIVALLIAAARFCRPGWFALESRGRAAVPVVKVRRTALASLALAFLAGQSLALWLYALGGSEAFDQSTQARAEAGAVLVLALALVIAPLSEELLFRGAIYPLLRRKAGVIASALITAGVFGLLHGNVVQFAVTLPLALVLALVYEHTARIWHCVLIHLAFNLVATLVPAALLVPLANPVSVLLLTAAFLGCALMLYQKVAVQQAADAAGAAQDPLGA